MAGATARKSSMASSPVTERTRWSFFVSSLHRSHTCFNAATAGSSFRPLGVESRGNATAERACRASSQVRTSPRAAKAAAETRNFSP